MPQLDHPQPMPVSEVEALEVYLDCLADCLEDGTMNKRSTVALLRNVAKRLARYTKPEQGDNPVKKVEVPLQMTERQIHEVLSALAIHDEDLQARHNKALEEGDKRLADVYACRIDIAIKAYRRLHEALEHHEHYMRQCRG